MPLASSERDSGRMPDNSGVPLGWYQRVDVMRCTVPPALSRASGADIHRWLATRGEPVRGLSLLAADSEILHNRAWPP